MYAVLKQNIMINKFLFSALICITYLFGSPVCHSQTIPVGSGSYTKTFPGTDEAGRNGYPSGSPQLSGDAVGKPVPTNDWWSKVVKEDHTDNLFNYPFAMKTLKEGLIASYIPWGVYGDHQPFVIGLEGLNASKVTVSDYSDWTATMQWKSGTHQMDVTAGIGMPFLYFTKNTSDIVKIKVNNGNVTISNEKLIIVDAASDADFVIYAPTGSAWQKAGSEYTSSLNGKNYWSMAMLPQANTNPAAIATEYQKYAYVFPKNTSTHWQFDESTSLLRTNFMVETNIKEGTDTVVLMGLLPHQWNNLASTSPIPDKHEYTSVRGKIKTMAGNRFSVEHTFHGILPTLPYVNNYSEGFNIAEMTSKIALIENDGLATWTDSYNEGQVMNRLIQVARIADLMGNTASRDKMLATIKERLEDWLTYQSGEKAFLFYYNTTWSAMLGYPAGHGQDNNINDHHFHWGYFIHAASFLEQFEPGWAADWGEMVNHLVHDAATPNRAHEKYPFLRNFSPYAGHCWANGFASFPQGNDQESTSESMQFNSSLIHWGSVTGNKEIRDLGIYLYTTEQTAIEEYWFDMYERNFKPDQQYSLVSRVWGNSYDNGTFWTSDIAASYGIEMYPIHGGSLYLGQNTDYVQKLWTEITKNTGILNNEANPNLWHDVMWKYLAFIDPAEAIKMYNTYPERELKFGISDAQTYYWLHAMNALGTVDVSITADYPIAAAFKNGEDITYTAHNYSNSDITVTYSDGNTLVVPAGKMVTSKDIDIEANLTSSFDQAYINGSVDLMLTVDKGAASKVEFYDGNELIGELVLAPYNFKAGNLKAGVHNFYAKVYEDAAFGVSNIASVVVGLQVPYTGTAIAIPGTFESALYDSYEGGRGQGIAYNDVSPGNAGDFRPNEYVDATQVNGEGATVGWISNGEWLEYTVNIAQSGLYNLSLRYASGNNAGGGPFNLLLDNKMINENISVSSSGDWDKWNTKTVNDIPLIKGQHVLKVEFKGGELNFGKLTFEYSNVLPYNQPIANAGGNLKVLLPANTASLDASQSENPGEETLTYSWTQNYGPSNIVFDDANSSQPQISNLEDGIYGITLKVSNGTYDDIDDMLVVVSDEDNLAPTVSIKSPENDAEFIAGKAFTILAQASDLDGSIAKVDFYVDDKFIGSSNTEPYSYAWTDAKGNYALKAIATDDKGKTGTSHMVNVVLTEAPSCEGTAHNGDFHYRFSDDANNPTLTFIPAQNGTGSPTCILYYGTGGGPFPGYGVKPNVPFKINGKEGETVTFYYTYSYLGGGEKNTADHKISYVIGSCQNPTAVDDIATSTVKVYPNPVSQILSVVSETQINALEIRNLVGQVVKSLGVEGLSENIEVSDMEAGHYILILSLENGQRSIQKIIKK